MTTRAEGQLNLIKHPKRRKLPSFSIAIKLAGIVLGFICFADSAYAMDFRISGQYLIMSGTVNGIEPRVFDAVMENNPGITTVILKNSGGGDARAGFAVAGFIRKLGLNTALSGYCRSSCANIFIGGNVRSFSDDQPLEKTLVAYHAVYADDNRYKPGEAYSLKGFYLKLDGKVNPELMSKWINIEDRKGFVYFYHQQASVLADTQKVLFCRGTEARDMKIRQEQCEKLEFGDALANGIVTTWDILQVKDAVAASVPVGTDGKIIKN